MAKDRKAHEVVEELLCKYKIDEKGLAEKAGVSELVVRNYLSGLNKDSKNYSTFKGKVKKAFELGDDFFSEEHVWEPVALEANAEPVLETKPVRTRRPRKKPGAMDTDPEVGVQLVFDQKGKISQENEGNPLQPEEKQRKKTEGDLVKNDTAEKKNAPKKQEVKADSLMSTIKASGSKAKLSGKKKDITPEAAENWAAEYEEEVKQSIGKVFEVLKESLKENFVKEEMAPKYANRKITEIVELASKAKEDDLNLIIAMLKKITK